MHRLASRVIKGLTGLQFLQIGRGVAAPDLLLGRSALAVKDVLHGENIINIDFTALQNPPTLSSNINAVDEI
jgi:hypothetical protein